jgi:hypothetical protein
MYTRILLSGRRCDAQSRWSNVRQNNDSERTVKPSWLHNAIKRRLVNASTFKNQFDLRLSRALSQNHFELGELGAAELSRGLVSGDIAVLRVCVCLPAIPPDEVAMLAFRPFSDTPSVCECEDLARSGLEGMGKKLRLAGRRLSR